MLTLFHSRGPTFQSLGIAPSVCRNLRDEFNITLPTAAQAEFLGALQSGRDLLLRDRTGSGKTFGLAIYLASRLSRFTQDAASSSLSTTTDDGVRTLYVVPNNALAAQIMTWISLLHGDRHDKKTSISLLQRTPLLTPLTATPHTLVGTPAKLLEAIENNTLRIDALDCLVLEEVDQAIRLPSRYAPLKKQKLREAHPKPTQRLVEHLLKSQHKPQVAAASATLNRPLRHWMESKGWVADPVFVDITKSVEAKDPYGTKHHCLLVGPRTIRNLGSRLSDPEEHIDEEEVEADPLIESVAVIHDIEPVHNGVLFVGASRSVADVADRLHSFGIEARDIREFATFPRDSERTPIWIATDFSARGMDIPDVSHVFILGEPASATGYVHMAGRTGRLGHSNKHHGSAGKVITLVEDKGRAEERMRNMLNLVNANLSPYEHVE
ncbi:P-loop containing nucleoside triphosphate hydrolase protein [Dichotomocladium elegans]|nr:P-loop containing nucleoside triphosphate hydrolase protein [Dichotomocladium elegans]